MDDMNWIKWVKKKREKVKVRRVCMELGGYILKYMYEIFKN